MSSPTPLSTSSGSGSHGWVPPTQGTLVPERGNFLGHPVGLFLLFMVEMWERFSYYGMRALLVLYLTSPTTGMRKLPPGAPAGFNPGPGWTDESANTLYGWYTGLAYLLPVIGGMIADRLIGTHRSMIVGGLLIMLGHISLAVSGMPALGEAMGMSVFIFGLAIIVIGTGHFKPSVSVMVGQLYKPGDPRRDGAFSIFYMGINLGAFLCAFVCGTLGEKVGWHWGFGAAAVGMGLGLGMYTWGRKKFLQGIGEAPGSSGRAAPLFVLAGCVLAAAFAWMFHTKQFERIGSWLGTTTEKWPIGTLPAILLAIGVVTAAFAFVNLKKKRSLSGGAQIAVCVLIAALPVVAWQLSLWVVPKLFGMDNPPAIDLSQLLGTLRGDSLKDLSKTVLGAFTLGLAAETVALATWFSFSQPPGDRGPVASIFIFMFFNAFFWLAFEQAGSSINLFTDRYTDTHIAGPGSWEMPTTWFQSVNPALIFIFAPLFAMLWTALGRRGMNPSQPMKIAWGLILLGLGFVVLVWGARTINVSGTGETAQVLAKANLFFILGAYFLHTMGELCLSPTGLSYVTKAAPVRFVSLLMGIWFISSFIANLSGGLIAAQTERIERGEIKLPWSLGSGTGSTQADFFMLFVVTSVGAGIVILVLTPVLKKLLRSPND